MEGQGFDLPAETHMSHLPAEVRARVTLLQLHAWHHAGRKLVMTTAYDAVTARIADAAGVDMILVATAWGMFAWASRTRCP
jgi:3-methyl-2-oxobutanoate hydroxymethyltransferase